VRYGSSLRIVFRHQPLPFHNNAERAAQASVAAHRQGRLWEFHDTMFRNQQRLDPANGTPTSLVNGLMVVGAQPVESFAKVIDAELRAAGKVPR
jgi:protein-disulfide isomerase